MKDLAEMLLRNRIISREEMMIMYGFDVGPVEDFINGHEGEHIIDVEGHVREDSELETQTEYGPYALPEYVDPTQCRGT